MLDTDYKPLVSLLGPQALTELHSRIQQFSLRLMRYSYSILHTSSKALLTADTLSPASVSQNIRLWDSDKCFMEDTNIYVDEIMSNLHASSTYLTQLKITAQRGQCLCRGHLNLQERLARPQPTHRASESLLARKSCTPTAMFSVLDSLHKGYQGMTKCTE